MNKIFNTRVAPSPTGFFHLGTARVAYHNWLVAKNSGGKFILRIDDTDSNRNNNDYIKVIYDSMSWLGLDYDNTFSQSSRFDHYKNVADLLIKNNLAKKDDNAIRLCTNNIIDSWQDFYGKNVVISPKDQQIGNDLVIVKSDQNPTYHFASIVDDIDYDINLIIRGADHISNTSKQLFILKALQLIDYPKSKNQIDFIHPGLIMLDGKKMSKRDGASNLMNYKDNYDSNAILNFILKLGWSHKDPNFDKKHPLISKDMAKDIIFDGAFRSVNCSFDQKKLDFLDKKWKNLK